LKTELISEVSFIFDFFRSEKIENLWFAFMAILFGLSGILFQFSSPWDDEWWSWHFLRVIAYFIVFWFIALEYKIIISNLKKHLVTVEEKKEIEKKIQESEKRFRQITENASEWIWETDAKGLYTYDSPIVEKLLGYKPEEVVEKNIFMIYFILMTEKS